MSWRLEGENWRNESADQQSSNSRSRAPSGSRGHRVNRSKYNDPVEFSNERFRHESRDRQDSSNGPSRGNRGGRGGFRRGGGHPAGLKGAEIGMYYRDRNRTKKQPEPQTVSLDARKEREISRMLGLTTHNAGPSYANQRQEGVKKEPICGLDDNYSEDCKVATNSSQNPLTCKEVENNMKLKSEWGDDWWAASLDLDNITAAGPSDGKRLGTEAELTDEYTEVQKRKIIKKEKEETVVVSNSQLLLSKLDVGAVKINSDISESDVERKAANKYSHVGESAFKRKFLQNITGNMETNLERSIAQRSCLSRNARLDEQLKADMLRKQESSENYLKMMAFRSRLPAYHKQREILDLLEQNQVIVISGETGCGKTTQVGQFILDDFILQGKGSACHVVCTQPRRISATSVAQRVADERDEVLGAESTGFQIRLEKKIPRKQGSIVFCTTGVMLQWMLSDPGLTSISHLILDEIHERDVTSDFVITLLKSVIPKRPDLKIILMSATLNAEQFSAYYGNCPSINIPGFTFPVQVNYLEDVLEMTNFEFPQVRQKNSKVWHKYVKKQTHGQDSSFDDFVLPYVRQLESAGKYSRQTRDNLRNPESEKINVELIATLLHHICTAQRDGAILVFLPGWSEISKLHSELANTAYFSSSRYLIIPLHSMMPTTVQRSVFDRPPRGVRKIILATNIAETSITIDDVVFVVDCGKIKMTNFDVKRNISTLKPEWVSLANAKQRRGRSGRVQDGVCYHLYTKGREMTFADYPLPEMLRTTLEQVVLQIKILQIGFVKPFLERVMDPPDKLAVELSLKMLRTLNALDDDENLTPLGYHLAKLPMDPRAGKMILMAAIFSCVDPILSIAAGLNFKDPFVLPLGKEEQVHKRKLELAKGTKSDHLLLAEAVHQWEEAKWNGTDRQFCRDNFLSHGTLQLLRDMKNQLGGYLHEMNFLDSANPKARDANLNSSNVNLLKAIICAGLYPNVALVRMKNRRGKEPMALLSTPEDGKVSMHIRSVNEKVTHFESHFLLYHMKLRSSGIFLHDTTMVHPLPLLFFGEGVHFSIKDGRETINVNEHIFFRCRESTANIVKVLRKKLDWILENKISHPGMIDWNDADEGGILREIIKLITIEDKEGYYV